MTGTSALNQRLAPRYIVSLAAAAGLRQLIVDRHHAVAEHERHRGLGGLAQRSGEGVAQACVRGPSVQASVMVNLWSVMKNCQTTLRRLGFDDVAGSYPRYTTTSNSCGSGFSSTDSR